MFLSQWLHRFAQQRLLRGGKRRHSTTMRPHLEMLEDRLTPSGDVLAIVGSGQPILVGQESQAITVQLENSSGKPIAATSNVTVNLSSSSRTGQFIDDSVPPWAPPSLVIPKGASSASFNYLDSQAGTPTLTAKASALHLTASRQEAVGVWAVFPTFPATITPGQPSQLIAVQLDQSNGPNNVPFTATNPVTIQLTSSSHTGQFLDASGKVLPNASLTIPAGSSSANFEYQDSQAGLPTLSASLDGVSMPTQVNVGVSLAFATPARNFTVGQKSQPITVQLQDSHGKAVATQIPLNLFMSNNSSTGTIIDTHDNVIAGSYSIPAGSNSFTFTYRDSVGGRPTLTMSVPMMGLSATQQETVAGPYQVVIEAPPATIIPNQPSQPITLQLRDSTGNVATATSAVTVPLSSSSSSGQFLDASGKVLANGRLIIPAGASSASFAYKDSKVGFPTLTISANGYKIPMQVNVGVSLVFTTPAQSLKANQPSGTITVQLQDGHGKAVNAPNNLALNVNSNSMTGTFLDNLGFAFPYPGFTIAAGSSSVSFKYEDSMGGKPTLTANASSWGGMVVSATQQETVVGPYHVEVGTPPSLIPQNQPSQPITFQLHDSTGNVAAATSAMTVQLSSSSSSGQFLDASGKVLVNGRLIIPAGASSAGFEYKDSSAGFPMLTISANGGVASQLQVNVGVSLVFTTLAQTLKANQPSGTITVQMQDSHGKAVNGYGNLSVNVTSNSTTGTFFDSLGISIPYPSFSFPAGSSSVSFKYEDSMGGKPTLTAYVESMSGPSLSATQQETVVGPYQVVVGTPPAPIAQNQPSQPITLQLRDSTGNVATAKSAVTVQLSSSSSSGQFLDASGKVLANGRLTIPAGSSSAGFEYEDSQGGFPTLTISANGGVVSQLQVSVGVSLVFTTPAQSLKAGQMSQLITVQLQDSHGKAISVPSTFNISLASSSTTGKFFDAMGNPFQPYFSIPAGTSSASFKYEDSLGGKPTLLANVSSITGVPMTATQKETVAGPFNLMFASDQEAPIAPNKPSQPFTIELLDSTGNMATTKSAVTVQLSSSSSSGQFLDASGKVLANGRLTIPAGSSSAQFEYRDSKAGFPTLSISANGVTSQQQVNVGVSLVFTTPAQSFKAGQTSKPMTVQLQDANGKPFITPNSFTFYLTSSLGTVQFLNTSSNLGPATIIIPTGSSSASFAITSSAGGKPTLTATLNSFPYAAGVPLPDLQLMATQQETIQGLSTLMFTTSPQTLTAGQKSQRVTLQLEDNNGKAASAPSGGLSINLSGGSSMAMLGSGNMEFFDANGKPLPDDGTASFHGSTIFMPAGARTVSFEFETTQAGSFTLYAGVSNGFWGTQVETIQAGPPRSLVFHTPTQSLTTGVPSGSITVQLQDQYGNPVVAGSGGLTFTLHSSSSGGAFLSADGDPLASPSITIPQGLSSATFEYKDSQAGTPTLTVSAKGVSATQKESLAPISAEIHVTNTKDSGSGSLRAAIASANAHPGSTIVFDAGVKGAIDLLSALPAIAANTNLVGPGANLLTLERSAAATADFGILVVGSPTNTTEPVVTLSGLTLANGTGTGLTNYGYLTVQRVVVKNNQAPSVALSMMAGFPYVSPGGIGNFGALTVLNSTIANNSATNNSAAGIDSEGGSVLIVNSTISGNTGIHTQRAGGIAINGGTALIENSTISGNTTIPWFDPLGTVGGITSDGQVALYDTIVAGNTGSASNATDVSGAFLSLGHNLIGVANQFSSGFVSSDLVGTMAKPIDPKLGPLQNSGGSTPTMAPRKGSPAIAAGSSIDAAFTDQDGQARPRQGAIDIGAFEVTTHI